MNHRQICFICNSPQPEWDELCQVCWEDYSGKQWCRALGGKHFQTVEEWIKEVVINKTKEQRLLEYNPSQLVLSLISEKTLETIKTR